MKETKSTIRFSGKLFQRKATETTGLWAFLTLPKNASAKLPSRDKTMVEGIINGFPFRAALEPDGAGSHELRLSKALHAAAGAESGETATVEITRIGEELEIRVPVDLAEALEAAPRALALWVEITPMARRDWIRWVTSPKQDETRTHRIETGCDMLTKGKRRPCCFPGINWVTKGLVTSDETWLTLPSSKNRPSPKATKCS